MVMCRLFRVGVVPFNEKSPPPLHMVHQYVIYLFFQVKHGIQYQKVPLVLLVPGIILVCNLGLLLSSYQVPGP